MRSMIFAAAFFCAALAAGCATYDATPVAHNTPGTEAGTGPFPSQVVGP